MNFESALSNLRNGHYLYREGSNVKPFKLANQNSIRNAWLPVVEFIDGEILMHHISSEELFAEDWEIYTKP